MKTPPLLSSTLLLAAVISISGCASIISGTHKNVSLDSNPPGAHVTIKDDKSREVASLTTPCVASLKRGAGYFVGAHYIATIEKSGYQTQQVNIHPTGNGWSFGNLVFGGLIGLLIVDPATGGMFNLSPDEVTVQLVPTSRR